MYKVLAWIEYDWTYVTKVDPLVRLDNHSDPYVFDTLEAAEEVAALFTETQIMEVVDE